MFCRFRRDLYKSILALLFATKEINQNHFLPNITLGFYMYDSCFSEATSLKTTLQVVTGGGNPVPNYKCGLLHRVPAIIGDPLSSSIVSMSRVLGLWRIPQVSFFSLSNALR